MGQDFSVRRRYVVGKASVGLCVQNHILRRFVYGWVHCWMPGDCKAADPFIHIMFVANKGTPRACHREHIARRARAVH